MPVFDTRRARLVAAASASILLLGACSQSPTESEQTLGRPRMYNGSTNRT